MTILGLPARLEGRLEAEVARESDKDTLLSLPALLMTGPPLCGVTTAEGVGVARSEINSGRSQGATIIVM